MIACGGGDDGPTPTPGPGDPGTDGESPGAVLIGKWVQGTIAGPAEAEFTDFSITFSASNDANVLNYATTNTQALVFPASGTFTLPASPNFETGAQLTRNDAVPVDMKIIDGKLEMKLTVEADSGVPTDNSRVAEVAGEYTFLLDKE